MKRATLKAVTKARANGESLVLARRLDTGEERLIVPASAAGDALSQAALKAAQRDQSGSIEVDGQAWFLNVFNPPPKLYIVGAVHIAQPLSQMAALSAFD